MRIVLDTNVIVSALLKQGSIPDQVLEQVVARRCELVVDSRIVAEYRDVMARPEFGFSPRRLKAFFRVADEAEWVVADPLALTLPEDDDRPFIETAVAGDADALVTGNVKDFQLKEGRLAIPILTPRQFIDMLARR
jgi:uncharacterized protein